MWRLISTPTACQKARCRLTFLFVFSGSCTRSLCTIQPNTAEFDTSEVRLWGVSGEIHPDGYGFRFGL